MNGEIHKNSQFTSHIFIIFMFQGYRCKSGMASFAYRVTRNYAYRPLEVHFQRKNSSIFLYTAAESPQQMGNDFEEGK